MSQSNKSLLLVGIIFLLASCGAATPEANATLRPSDTQVPTQTSTDTATATHTATETLTPTITLTPTKTLSPTPSETPTPAPVIALAVRNGHCRVGPGEACDRSPAGGISEID